MSFALPLHRVGACPSEICCKDFGIFIPSLRHCSRNQRVGKHIAWQHLVSKNPIVSSHSLHQRWMWAWYSYSSLRRAFNRVLGNRRVNPLPILHHIMINRKWLFGIGCSHTHYLMLRLHFVSCRCIKFIADVDISLSRRSKVVIAWDVNRINPKRWQLWIGIRGKYQCQQWIWCSSN